MQTMYVKPAVGLRVRDPRTGEPLSAEGAVVPVSGYWLRRLRDGDVLKSRASKAAKPKE